MTDNATLITQIHEGSKVAKDIMVKNNMGLVYNIAGKFTCRGCEKEDLVQIGVIGLIKAIDKFDSSYDVQFSTYAVPMIMGEIRRFLRDDGILKVSRTLKETALKGRRAQEKLQKALDREPTISEISIECGISTDELSEAFEASTQPDSLYGSAYSNGEKEILIMDTLADEDSEEKIMNKVLINDILSNLTGRERQIVVMRYFKGKTQAETAKIIGVSQVQISRLEKKIIENLKNNFV